MLIDCRQAGRTLGLRGPHLARGPDLYLYLLRAGLVFVFIAGRIRMLIDCRQAGRTLGLRGPHAQSFT